MCRKLGEVARCLPRHEVVSSRHFLGHNTTVLSEDTTLEIALDDTFDCLGGAQFFSTLDLASGYWQVEMDPVDKQKTAFSTHCGHYEFNRMPFGLSNAPANFQQLMQLVLRGFTWEQALHYLDDVIVPSASFAA